MSRTSCALHIYGINVTDLAPLKEHLRQIDEREKENFNYWGTLRDILGNYLNGDHYAAPVYDYLSKVSWDIFWGPNNSIWIGYEATMPYVMPKMTQKMMDRELYISLVHLCGKREAEKAGQPKAIFEIWSE